MDCGPQGSFASGILQVRTLGWVAMPSSKGTSKPRDRTHVSGGSCNAGRLFIAESPGKLHIYTTMCKITSGRLLYSISKLSSVLRDDRGR